MAKHYTDKEKKRLWDLVHAGVEKELKRVKSGKQRTDTDPHVTMTRVYDLNQPEPDPEDSE